MRELFRQYKKNETRIITAYADAEKSGIVTRKSNIQSISAEQYARALLQDGIRKGWIY